MAFAASMAATPPRSRSSSASGSTTSPARRIACRSPVWLPPKPPLARKALTGSARPYQVTQRQPACDRRDPRVAACFASLVNWHDPRKSFARLLGLSRRDLSGLHLARKELSPVQAGKRDYEQKVNRPSRARPVSRRELEDILFLRRNVLRLLRFIWRSSVPKLHAFKRGLMHLSLFWRRLTILAGEIRTQVMVEIERNPLAVRQGAATIMCLAAAAVAMPVISHRAAEQRDGAEWAATSTAFQQRIRSNSCWQTDPNARVELTSLPHRAMACARAARPPCSKAPDARAMMVQAVLRGPIAPSRPAAVPTEPQIDARQHNCLAQAIYYEARGESQRARSRSPK